MKKLFIYSFFFFITSLTIAQEIVNEKTVIKDGKTYKVVTTKKGEGSPIPSDMLTPGHETHKIRLQDSINKSDFNVKFYLEEYSNSDVKSEDKALHSSFRSIYVNEIIINRMTSNLLSIIMQTPSFTWVYYVPDIPDITKENFVQRLEEKNRYKWKIFPETPFEKNVPVFLIYEENQEEDVLEKKIDGLFTSSSFKNLKDKDAIVRQIKTVINNFYLFLYDVTN